MFDLMLVREKILTSEKTFLTFIEIDERHLFVVLRTVRLAFNLNYHLEIVTF